ncbi:hypothetical protein [Litoreibacter roseus]|uniref:Uncharacterized protein n=1 Tax=Litoreibacter roseus TaxID=2601869 RepID=A0A6N6JC98_9RHOB|nr:hypothetical protein [Litoreibacter roseus]GFE63943.1 hypothetical protein KIN_10170 [Litoreibacter roseus]
MSASANITLSDFATEGETITSEHMGSNYAFQWERIGDKPWEKFDEVMESTGVEYVRYPGGTAAETWFDINNPNADSYTKSNGSTQEIMPLDGFLDYMAETGLKPIIIIPTNVMLGDSYSDGHRTVDENWEDDLRTFIRNTLAYAGENGIHAFELGNEYESYMTSREYGRVASWMAEIVQQELDAYMDREEPGPSWEEPQITVQAWGLSVGGGTSIDELVFRNEVVMSEFNETEAAAVDAITSHFYYLEGRHEGKLNEQNFENIENATAYTTDLMQAWVDAGYTDIEFVMSEWNVLHSSTTDTGLTQIPVLLEMFTSFISQGVDQMQFWSSQYHGTSLALSNGQLMSAGVLFEIMTGELIGSRVLDLDYASSTAALHGFQVDTGFKLFLSSMTDEEQDITLDLGNDFGLFTVTGVLQIGVDESTADGSFKGQTNIPAYMEPDAAIETTEIDPETTSLGDSSFTFEFGAHEVVVVDLELRDDAFGFGFGFGGIGYNKIDTEDGSGAMVGTEGRDNFIFGEEDSETTVINYDGAQDTIDLTDLLAQSAASTIKINGTEYSHTGSAQAVAYQSLSIVVEQVDGGTRITATGEHIDTGEAFEGTVAVLEDVDASSLNVSNFEFG